MVSVCTYLVLSEITSRLIMNRNFVLFITLLLLIPAITQAQRNRNETRLRTLKKSIERIEARLADAEYKMGIGDSLIHYGDRLIAQADKDFFRIADEVKKINKVYRSKRRKLYKLSKSSNREVAMQARDDLRELETEHRLVIREYADQAREMKKKAMKADSDIRRGQQLQSMAARTIKSAQKDLREARERYELAMSWGS